MLESEMALSASDAESSTTESVEILANSRVPTFAEQGYTLFRCTGWEAPMKAMALLCAITLLECGHFTQAANNESDLVAKIRQRLNPIDKRICGPQCLYYLAVNQQIECSWNTILDSFSIGDKGVSLLDLRNAAGAIGLTTRVVRCAPIKLVQIELPAIALLESTDQAKLNHYVVVLTIADNNVEVFDPFLGTQGSISLERFENSSSGMFLVVDSQFLPFWTKVAMAIGVVITIIGLLELAKYRQKNPKAMDRCCPSDPRTVPKGGAQGEMTPQSANS